MLVAFFQLLIKCYSYAISPLLGSNCRYSPSCSEYSSIAFERFGAIRGGILTIKRLCRCHPWGGDGYDPVPEKPLTRQKEEWAEKDDKST